MMIITDAVNTQFVRLIQGEMYLVENKCITQNIFWKLCGAILTSARKSSTM